METVANRWASVQEKIHQVSKGNSSPVKVIAISKKQPFSKILEAAAAGITDFGENYVQEALPKIQEAQEKKLSVHWHYVGSLQTNKMNKIVPVVDWLHSIDQISQIEKLEKMRASGTAIPKILIQLNLADENTKSGLLENQIKPFFENIAQHTQLTIDGLMTFPPLQTDPEKNRGYFAKAVQWMKKINAWKLDRIRLNELSMGVSSDFQVAIEEGATMVRLGEILFGPRL